jgi:nicotinic acid phosphoribosyltransferase
MLYIKFTLLSLCSVLVFAKHTIHSESTPFPEIKSILDLDLYKLIMQQAILIKSGEITIKSREATKEIEQQTESLVSFTKPDTMSEYQLKWRRENLFTPEAVELLKKEIARTYRNDIIRWQHDS